MNFLTEKQVKVAVRKSKKATLVCGIEHWKQLSEVTMEELSRYSLGKTRGEIMGVRMCALCVRYRKGGHCTYCPVRKKSKHACCIYTPFNRALVAYRRWWTSKYLKKPVSEIAENWRNWKVASKKEYEFLKSLEKE